jgi:hypothetical protein
MSPTQWLLVVAGLVLVVGGVGGLITSRPGGPADPATARARRPGCVAALFIAAAAPLLALADLAPAEWETPLSVAQVVASVAGAALALTSAVRHYRLNSTRGARSDNPS